MTSRTTQRRTADEIVEAVCGAAHDLFVDRGPSSVSLREIAAKADVNLGLIHRYVGSKEALVALVLEQHTARVRTSVSAVEEHAESDLLEMAANAAVSDPSTGRLLAGMLLDGVDVAALKGDFPLLERLRREGDAVDSVMTMALLLGWEVFGPALLRAARLGSDDDATRDALLRALTATRQ